MTRRVSRWRQAWLVAADACFAAGFVVWVAVLPLVGLVDVVAWAMRWVQPK